MRGLDLIHQKNKTGHFEFKHALVRDALYNSLLSNACTALHLRIAVEIERRSGNRLIEVAEILAYHYSQTAHSDKAFIYLCMAGNKSLSVYSFEEAANHFNAALKLLDKNPDCASDDQIAEFFDPYARLLFLRGKFFALIDAVERNLARIDRLGD